MLASACSSPYKGLSKADYVKQANATCKSYDTKVTNAVSASGLTEKSSQDQQVTLLETKVVPLLRQQVADLRKLKPPKADRKQVKAIVDGMATGTDSAEHELKTNPKNALSSSFNPLTAS